MWHIYPMCLLLRHDDNACVCFLSLDPCLPFITFYIQTACKVICLPQLKICKFPIHKNSLQQCIFLHQLWCFQIHFAISYFDSGLVSHFTSLFSREVAQWLRVHVLLVEDQSLLPNTHIGLLTTVCNCRFLMPLASKSSVQIDIHTQTHTHIIQIE